MYKCLDTTNVILSAYFLREMGTQDDITKLSYLFFQIEGVPS